jgi:hypothetical protein
MSFVTPDVSECESSKSKKFSSTLKINLTFYDLRSSDFTSLLSTFFLPVIFILVVKNQLQTESPLHTVVSGKISDFCSHLLTLKINFPRHIAIPPNKHVVDNFLIHLSIGNQSREREIFHDTIRKHRSVIFSSPLAALCVVKRGKILCRRVRANHNKIYHISLSLSRQLSKSDARKFFFVRDHKSIFYCDYIIICRHLDILIYFSTISCRLLLLFASEYEK